MALNRAKVLETADKLVRQGKLEEAIKHYMVLSDDNPRDVNTINRIGDLYVRLRKNKEGIRQFMRIADFYAGDGFHLKAIAMYKKITKLEPTHVEANERLADMYARQGLTTEARSQFVALAEQCLKSGQKDKALTIYEKVLHLEPGNVKVRLLVAEIHSRDGDAARAFEGLMAVVAELRKRGLAEEALKVLQKASRMQPSHTEVLGQMAELLQATGKSSQEVVGVLETLHRGNPENLQNLQALGEAYLAAGRSAEFEKLVDSSPPGEAKIVLMETEARFLASRHEPDKAVQRLRSAADEALKRVSADKAAALLEEALTLAPEEDDILEGILEIWTQAAKREGMISALERLVQLQVRREDWTRAALALGRLEDLAPESAVALELRKTIQAHVESSPEELHADSEGDSKMPSLDELEKVVELDVADDPVMDAEESIDLLVEESPQGELGMELAEETPGDPEEISTEEGFVEQEEAYSGRSVIQEMRGDPSKPEIDEDFVSEHVTEAEVFLKYGLVEKAREQLQAVLDRYPNHLHSLMKMKEVHTEEGRKSEAARVALRVAEIFRENGDEEKGAEWEEQAKDLDPGAAPGPGPGSKAVDPSADVSELEIPVGTSISDLNLDLDEVARNEGAVDRPAAQSSSGLDLLETESELSIDLVEETDEGDSGDSRFNDRIHQMEFSLQQGLREEAEEILRGLESEAPSHPELARLRAGLAENSAVSQAPPLPIAGGDLDMDVEMAFGGSERRSGDERESSAAGGAGVEDGFFDLAAELKAHAVDSTPEESPAGLTRREEENIDEIFKAFRRKVDQQVEEEDYETRYNLGIAYKEMGLLDEAIGEFQYASRDPKLFMECCSILGICFREKGMSDLAVKWYRKALESTGHPEEKYLGLRYDLGELYLERGEHGLALSLFSEVYGSNSNYRDVTSRIRELKKRVG